MSPTLRIPAAILIAVALTAGIAAFDAQGGPGRQLAISLALGAAFGVVLQRSRFCFLCNFRDFTSNRDARGLLSIIVALAIGAIGYTMVFGAWMPVPAADRLPPDAHIGPVSWLLPVAAGVFGFGMALSGSCLSAHLYRLGEGSIVSILALLGALAGFGIGFKTWNALYLTVISDAKPIWLPQQLGYGGALGLTLTALAALALLVLWMARPQQVSAVAASSTLDGAAHAVFIARWPGAVGGILIGMISTLAYLRVAPLGVTAELGSIARTAASKAGLLPDTLFGLDGFRGCATLVKETLFSNNGVFVLGLVGASFAAALLAGQFHPRRPSVLEAVKGFSGGLLMGWGSMTALGCTVGVLLSGIHAGAVTGWIFLAACTAGVWIGLQANALLARR